MNPQEKFELIKRNTAEIIGEDELKELLESNKELSVYIGTAPTGAPHIGYFIWGLKLADLLNAGFRVKVLIADLHAALDNTPWEILEHRYNFYSKIIPLMIKAMGTNITKLEFVKGSDFQLSKEYVLDIFKLSSMTSVHDCHKAASEVVKMGTNPKLSGYIYPLMQALDEQYLKVDMQIGAIDQRKIFVLAREQLPKLGYKKRIELMVPFLPGLIGKKMSSSIEASKIGLMDDKKTIQKKVNLADFKEGNPDNGTMAFFKYIIFTLLRDKNEKLLIERPEKFGGNLEFQTYEELEKAVKEKSIHPLDVKNTAAQHITNLLSEIESKRDELEKLEKLAYPKNI
ncbi:tyrosine--tRNA ligase [Candidatus Pacearchaeota archaeon]|nr:tyrosine--tRNA ligase [Candidatus Pacearchaeota archaeon]